MTPLENPPEPGPHLDQGLNPGLAMAELQKSYRSLWALLRIVVISVLILTGSMCLFLLREVSVTRRQVKELTEFVANYEKNSVPVLRQFRDKLIEFAKSNPDFGPILAKYVNPTNYVGTSQVSGGSPALDAIAPARMPTSLPK